MTFLLKVLLAAAILGAGSFIGQHFGNTFIPGWFSGLVVGVLITVILSFDE